MKQFSVFLISFFLLVGCSSEQKEVASEQTETTTYVANADVQLNIEGMTCQQMCAGGIQTRLKAMDGVIASKVDFDSKTATISYDNSVVNTGDFEAMIEKLHDGQYTVTPISEEVKMETESESETTDLNQVVTGSFELPNIFEFFTNLIRS